jgi:hypothetical protein
MMLYATIAIAQLLCAVSVLAPVLDGRACTPATHRARVGLGVVCCAFALLGWGRFAWFVVHLGHAIGADVVVGQTVAAVFAVHAVLLVWSIFPPRRVTFGLAALSVSLSMAAAVKAVLAFAAP